MTEELEIIIDAKVEEAVREIMKLVPAIKQITKQIQDAFSKIDTKTMQNKLQQTVRLVKEKIQSLNKSTQNSEITIKVNNKNAQQQITQIQNQMNKMPKLTQHITNNIKNMTSGIKQGLGHVIKYVGSLFSLKNIYSVLNNCASTWLSSQNAEAKQLSANIDYMKCTMGSVFAPVIQWVTNLIYNLMKAIQSVAYALFKVNIFDNNLSSESGGGIVTPTFDFSQIDNQMFNWINNVKEKMYTLFQPIQNAWCQYGQPLIESMRLMFVSNLELIKSMGKSYKEVWLNGTAEHTVGVILQLLTSMFNTIGNVRIAFTNAWENNGGTQIIQNLCNGFNYLLDIVECVIQVFEDWTSSQSFQDFANAIIGICGILSYSFELIAQKLKELWENGANQVFSNLLNFISELAQVIEEILQFLMPIVEYILNIVTPIISGIVKTISNTLFELWEECIKPCLEQIIELLRVLWEDILQPLICWIVENILPVLIPVFESLWNTISNVIGSIIEIISGIIQILTGIIEFIAGVFSGDWQKAWEGIKMFFSGIWDTIKAIVSTVWDAISGIILTAISIIQGVITSIFNVIATVISNIWNGIVNTISNVWNMIVAKVTEGVSAAWNAITSVFGGIANWFGNIFRGAWEAVKNVFSTGGAIFNGIKDGILNGLKTIVNAIIHGINRVIAIPFNGINAALTAIRSVDIMGLQPFSWISTIGVPQIPTLAKGGVLTQRTMFIGGEYSGASSNPEIVTPQNIMRETMEGVFSKYQGNNSDRPIYLTVNVNNKKLGQILIDDLRDMKRQTGNGLEALVGG